MGIVKRDSIAITVLSYVGVVVGYVNKILLFPNFLSEEQVGLTSILVSLAVMYAQFSALGINSTVVKFFPFFRTADKRHNGLFFWSALGVSVGFVLFTALFLIFREPVMHYFAKESPLLSEYYLLLIPLGLATLFYNFYSAWLQALSRTIISSAVNEVLLRLLITAEISLYALGVLNFEQFIVGYIAIYFVPMLILLLYTLYLRESHLHPVITSRTKKLVTIAGIYGLWQYLGGASVFLTNVIDQTMLAGMEGLMQGGIYAIMMYMVSAMLIPYRSMVKVATPVVTNLWKERDMAGMQRIHRDVSLMNLIVGCFFFLTIWINLDNIFSLMPASYSAGRYVFLFLGLGRIFEMYAGLTGVILITSKRYRYDFTFSVLLVGMTVASNAALIPSLGHERCGDRHDEHRDRLQPDPHRFRVEIFPHPTVRRHRLLDRAAHRGHGGPLGTDPLPGQFHPRRRRTHAGHFAAVRRHSLLHQREPAAQRHPRRPARPHRHPPAPVVPAPGRSAHGRQPCVH